jgi:energy-coupling factor transporter ATP-binding protein EcfA2
MAENGSKQRPVRTLTVKNFSVIKEAKLEFGKITVLIGPQASGKSLLCKLAYFLGKELVEQTITCVVQGVQWDEFLQIASRAISVRFTLSQQVVAARAYVEFSSNEYKAAFSWEGGSDSPTARFSHAFEEKYRTILSSYHKAPPSASGAFIPGGISAPARLEDVWIGVNQTLFGNDLRGLFYAPAGRAFFTDFTKGLVVAQNVTVDPITRDFAGQLLWDSDWKKGLLTTGRGVTDEINRRMTDIASGFVMIDSGTPRFVTIDGRKLTLNVLSTGIQELIPLFNILEQLMYFREHGVETAKVARDPQRAKIVSKPFLFLEEPEANVFPKTQYELVKLFAWLANDPVLDFDWVITTHSPYILSSFNNLIEAGQAARNNPNLHDQVAKIIPEQYWIKEGDFKAYAIENGKLKSILNESGFVEGNYLDQVSEVIGNEFDELLRLEYEHTKAS